MKAIKIILIAIGLVFILAVGSLWYVGYFSKIIIEDKQAGGYLLAGEDFTGPYMKVTHTMTKVDSILKTMNIVCTKGFGIYYDNPKETPQEKCRSFVGNIIEDKDSSLLDEIKSKGFKVEKVAVGQALVIEFPIKGNYSYMIGPMKVYPAFTKYIKEKNYKPKLAMEVYDISNKKIYFIMQYDK